MSLSSEERERRRERSRALIEESRRKDRAEKVAVIADIVGDYDVAERVYDGLTKRHYVIAKFDIRPRRE